MGRFFWCVSNALIHWSLRRNMPKACPYVVMRFAPSLIVGDMNHRILSKLTRIQRNSTRRLFVGICGDLWFGFKTTNFTIHTIFLQRFFSHKFTQISTNNLLVESRWICVSLKTPTKRDLREPWQYAMIHACHNKRGRKSHHNVGICFRLRHVSTQAPMYQRIENRPFGVLQKSSFMLLLLMIWTPVNNKVTFSLFIRFWRILFLNKSRDSIGQKREWFI